MGVSLYLRDENGETVQVPAHREGGVLQARMTATGTLEPMDTVEAYVSITYNYSAVYKLIVPEWDGLCALFSGRRAADVLPTLELIVARCGNEPRADDYWQATPGNAGAIMATIAEWCRLWPDAVFDAFC